MASSIGIDQISNHWQPSGIGIMTRIVTSCVCVSAGMKTNDQGLHRKGGSPGYFPFLPGESPRGTCLSQEGPDRSFSYPDKHTFVL